MNNHKIIFTIITGILLINLVACGPGESLNSDLTTESVAFTTTIGGTTENQSKTSPSESISSGKENVNILLDELTVDQKPLNFSSDDTSDTFLYNIEDPAKDSLRISAKSSIKGAKIDYSQTNGFKNGKNIVTITVTAPNGDYRKYKLIVYKYNKEDTQAVQLYNNAVSIYWLDSNLFETDEKEKIQWPDHDYLPRIKNYEDVLNNNFTLNAINIFEHAEDTNLQKQGEKIYGYGPQRGSKPTYLGTALVLKSQTNTKKEYTARSYYFDQKLITQDAIFTLKKENGKWLVDQFHLPN